MTMSFIKMRPSGHDISTEFQRDNGGAIPPNLLQISNTGSNSVYLRRWREEEVKPHPARFPPSLPDFFIRFLTRPGDLVLDPLAGSNTTGAAAEKLGRRWLSIEQNESYVEGSQFRFEPERPKAAREREKSYVIPPQIDIISEPMPLFASEREQ